MRFGKFGFNSPNYTEKGKDIKSYWTDKRADEQKNILHMNQVELS